MAFVTPVCVICGGLFNTGAQENDSKTGGNAQLQCIIRVTRYFLNRCVAVSDCGPDRPGDMLFGSGCCCWSHIGQKQILL